MKIAFSTSGEDLNAPLDSRFGRAEKFLVYDVERDTFEIVENVQNRQAAQGAGIQTAETVARLKVKGVVSGHCGPRAFRVLTAAGISVYPCDASTVAEALARFKAGELTAAGQADVEGHWM